jgi:hypothetical protein
MRTGSTTYIFTRAIFYSALAFIGISVFSLTIGQAIPVEFKSWHLAQEYYNIVFGGVPVAVLLTLPGTIKRRHPLIVNTSIIILTIAAAVFSFLVMVSLMFHIGFGAWETTSVLYRNKQNPGITIQKQRFDEGAFGTGGSRIVKLRPFLGCWYIVNRADTATLDKTKWNADNQ